MFLALVAGVAAAAFVSVRDSPPLHRAKRVAVQLTSAEERVMWRKGTEAPFSSPLNDEKREGVYRCKSCGEPLFSSDAKYDSKTGWPSFFDSTDRLKQKADPKWTIVAIIAALVAFPTIFDGDKPSLVSLCVAAYALRIYAFQTEILCQCGAHVGHVFDDGPRETTGKRYCANGVSLTFREKTESG